jgi:D-glycero-D-manno-heptose 1,7-bisphosphate phosphatase
MSRRAVFIDRDGVINELAWDTQDGRPESPLSPEDVSLIPSAPSAISALRQAGWLVVVASNQPAAAKGKVPDSALDVVHDRVVELLDAEGVRVDAWRYCRHRREDACACRKPRPGMLLDAARALDIDVSGSWMIGDTDADVQAGRNAGTKTALVAYPGSAHKRDTAVADVHAGSLAQAVGQILASGPRNVAGVG